MALGHQLISNSHSAQKRSTSRSHASVACTLPAELSWIIRIVRVFFICAPLDAPLPCGSNTSCGSELLESNFVPMLKKSSAFLMGQGNRSILGWGRVTPCAPFRTRDFIRRRPKSDRPTPALRGQSVNSPMVIGLAGILNSVVKPAWSALPKFNSFRV